MSYRSEPTPYGDDALWALRRAIDASKGGRPLVPVTVVVPSNAVGVAARRWLAAHGGIAAVQFVTAYRLAELLGGPTLVAAGRRPVSTPVIDVAVRRVLARSAGLFRPVAHHHATIAAFRSAHRELRHVPPQALDSLARAGSPRAREVVRLHRLVTAELSRAWYDEADLVHEACRHLAGAPARVIVHLPQRLRPTEMQLIDALAGAGDVTVLEGASEPLPPVPVEVVDVSDADEEAREAVRQVVAAAAEGTTLERMAIVWPLADPYARLVVEHLDLAGIEWNGRSGTALHERLAARLVLDTLALDRRGIRRADLFALLAHVPARQPDGAPVPTHRWERLSREAHVVSDTDWEGRLARFQQTLLEDPRRIHDAEHVQRLRAFVAELRRVLGPRDRPARWEHWATVCHQLLDHWLGGPRRIAQMPDHEVAALDAVVAAIDRLSRLDALDEPVTRSLFADALAAELDAAPGRIGRIGTGVQVGPLSFALGQSLDLLVVLGACEGQLPAPPAFDPLLADADRDICGGALARSDDVIAEQRRHLLAGVAGARRVVMLSPRGDLRATALRRPSRWIAELASQVPVTQRSVPSFAAGLADAPFPTTATQHRVRALAHHVRAGRAFDDHPLVSAMPALRGALMMQRARELPELTEYDGDLSRAGVPSPVAMRSAISPTRLESWVLCPYTYFVQHLLRVTPVEQPDTQLQITPRDRGTLVHAALDRFHRRVIDGTLPQPGPSGWTEAHAAALLAEFEAVATTFDDDGRAGRVAFWRADRARQRSELLQWLRSDSRLLVDRGATVAMSEVTFGHEGQSPAAFHLPGGRTISLRGTIDRVDRGRDGTIYVTDHKTGRPTSFSGITDVDPTAGGSKLQLASYAAAAMEMGNGSAPTVHAEYSFVAAGFKRIGITLTPEVWERVGTTVARIVDGIEAGLFFALPTKSQFRRQRPVCEYCDPDNLGTAERYNEFLRKSADPRLVALVADSEAETDG